LHIFNSHSFLSLLSILSFFLYKAFFFSILILFVHYSTSNLISEPWIFNFSSQLINLIRACGIFSLIWKKKSLVLYDYSKKNKIYSSSPSTMAASHTSKHPPQSTPSLPKSRSGFSNSHQNPRQFSTASTMTSHFPLQQVTLHVSGISVIQPPLRITRNPQIHTDLLPPTLPQCLHNSLSTPAAADQLVSTT